MRIVVDAHLPGVEEEFSGLGEVVSIPGHEIGPDVLKGATALIVRTVTKVDSALLRNSGIRFVGTATAGVDHVDREWLRAQGIDFASAAGANAESVVEYTLAALAEGLDPEMDYSKTVVGIVGGGHVGSLLATRLRHMGWTVHVSDPPFAASGRMQEPSVSLDELLPMVDILSINAERTTSGSYPTVGLLDAGRLSRLKRGAFLIHTARGGIVDDMAAASARRAGALSWLALDVWQDEPVPARTVKAAADIATPHIAGYSRDAKASGLRMISNALALAMGCPTRTALPHLPVDEQSMTIRVSDSWYGEVHAWRVLMRAMMDIRADDRRFRAVHTAEDFHRLRATYPLRYTFSRYTLDSVHPRWNRMARALGMKTVRS